jgi:hypothetical protein
MTLFFFNGCFSGKPFSLIAEVFLRGLSWKGKSLSINLSHQDMRFGIQGEEIHGFNLVVPLQEIVFPFYILVFIPKRPILNNYNTSLSTEVRSAGHL